MLQPRIARPCRLRFLPQLLEYAHPRTCNNAARRLHTRPSNAVIGQTAVPVDEDGIPLEAPYSINTFLSNLPAPSISDEQFVHLHKLSALIPPSPGTKEFAMKKHALEDMVRLVEGVRPNETDQKVQKLDHIPDGRIWPEDDGIHLDWEKIMHPTKSAKNSPSERKQEDNGKDLLQLATKQVAGYYVVKKRQAADIE